MYKLGVQTNYGRNESGTTLIGNIGDIVLLRQELLRVYISVLGLFSFWKLLISFIGYCRLELLLTAAI